MLRALETLNLIALSLKLWVLPLVARPAGFKLRLRLVFANYRLPVFAGIRI